MHPRQPLALENVSDFVLVFFPLLGGTTPKLSSVSAVGASFILTPPMHQRLRFFPLSFSSYVSFYRLRRHRRRPSFWPHLPLPIF